MHGSDRPPPEIFDLALSLRGLCVFCVVTMFEMKACVAGVLGPAVVVLSIVVRRSAVALSVCTSFVLFLRRAYRLHNKQPYAHPRREYPYRYCQPLRLHHRRWKIMH